MSREGKPPNRSEVMREAMIKGLEEAGHLAPGGADMIRSHVQTTPNAGHTARRVVEFVDGPIGSRAMMPGVEKDPVPLRRVASMFSQVAPANRRPMADHLHLELGHLRPGEQAQRIAEKLEGDRDFREKWLQTKPAPPDYEQTIQNALRLHFTDLVSGVNIADVARQIGKDPRFRVGSEESLVRSLAQHFSNGAIAAKLGVPQLSKDDFRLKFRSAAPTADDAPRRPLVQ